MGVAGQLVASTWKGTRIWIVNSTEVSSRRLGARLMDILLSMQKPNMEMMLSSKDLCLMEWILITYMRDTQGLENVSSVESQPAWAER